MPDREQVDGVQELCGGAWENRSYGGSLTLVPPKEWVRDLNHDQPALGISGVCTQPEQKRPSKAKKTRLAQRLGLPQRQLLSNKPIDPSLHSPVIIADVCKGRRRWIPVNDQRKSARPQSMAQFTRIIVDTVRALHSLRVQKQPWRPSWSGIS